jgi:hypothetical protein
VRHEPSVAHFKPSLRNFAVFDLVDTNDIHLTFPFWESSRDRFVIDDEISDNDTRQQIAIQIGLLKSFDMTLSNIGRTI